VTAQAGAGFAGQYSSGRKQQGSKTRTLRLETRAPGPLHAEKKQKGDTMKIVGILLIVLGIVALIYQGISYTRQETVVDAGPLEIQTERRETIPLPPLVGIISIVAGGFLVYMGTRQR
jgi:hypothetical protein